MWCGGGQLCKKDDDLLSRAPPPNLCALCGGELRAAGESVDDAHFGEAHAAAGQAAEQLFELECAHTFHEFCLLGWTIVGKKDTCPFCGDKVSLTKIAGASPWKRQSLGWSWLLDMVRYLLSWHPIILLALQGLLYEAGFSG